MREMLFRGKSIYDNEWIEGFYVHANEAYGENIDRHFIIKHGEFEYDNYDAWEVIPETVGQYTGLCDKNGKKIFEGDICQIKNHRLISEVPFVIEWEDFVYNGWVWEALDENKNEDSFTASAARICEVIGNIHDNPELLEVENVRGIL